MTDLKYFLYKLTDYKTVDLLQANGIVPNVKKRRAISSPTPYAAEGDSDEVRDQERIKALEVRVLFCI